METKKQEVIRKAYGELYEVMKENINHTTGSYLIESTHFYDKDNFYKRELFNVREYSDSLLVITPKSLQGIETNNGWIRIESEEDLPKKLGKYKVVLKNRVPFTWIFETFCDIESSGEAWLSRYSHYKEIEEELPPIY